jgi:Cellulase (glycosyl hydrolase family 5)/Glycoside hydrolase family 5 C-terminal domain
MTMMSPHEPYKAGNARDIHKEGTWFRDAEGRYVIFRGVNFSGRSKKPPYLPVMPPDIIDLNAEGIKRFHSELQAVQPYFDDMQRSGFNIVRLLVSWKAIEPDPNPTPEKLSRKGEIYLGLVGEIIDALYKRDIFVFIDFHQDVVHESCSGDGFPDWALAINDDHPRPNPSSDLRDKFWAVNYVEGAGWLHPFSDFSRLVRHTLRSFWHNDLFNKELSHENMAIAKTVRTHLEKTIGATACFFQASNGGRGHPGILGYEPFNEPHQAGIDKPKFERECLPTFYTNVLHEIRSPASGKPGDTKSFLFIEPRVDWIAYAIDVPRDNSDNGGLNYTLSPHTVLNTIRFRDERVVFSFHYYDDWTMSLGTIGLPDNMRNKEKEWFGIYAHMLDAAVSRNLIPFLTEFGASQDWSFPTELRPGVYNTQIRAYLDLQFKQIEACLVNATCWEYDLYNTNWNLEHMSLLNHKREFPERDIVARPYPIRSSAEPKLLFFDIETKHCAIVLHGQMEKAATVIFIPDIQYPKGFEVHATSAALSWDHPRQILQWFPDPTQKWNLIVICPPNAFNAKMLPLRVQELLPSAPRREIFRPVGASD